jgi:hypothetical protein
LVKLKKEHKNPAAEGYRLKMIKVQTVLFMSVYLDTVTVFSKVCKKFQERGLTLNEALISLKSARADYSLMLATPEQTNIHLNEAIF